MKRWIALCLTLALLLASAAAEVTTMREDEKDGLTVLRNHLQELTDGQQTAVDYPTFESNDAALQAFLEENVTRPIRELSTREPSKQGQEVIRGGYNVSLSFDGLLSVEASVRIRTDEADAEEIGLFSAIVDLDGKKLVSISELFNEPDVVVEEVICGAVYEKASASGSMMDSITDSGLVPLPDSYYLTENALRVTYAPGALCAQAAVLDLPWEELPLTYSSRMQAQETQAPEEAIAVIGGADGPTAIFVASKMVTPTLTPKPTVTPFPVETLDPHFSLPPVITPTPMPVAGNDAIKVDVLTHGLWKPLGGEGDTYYQFTEDGKLLTVTVSSYTVEDGVLESDVLNGVLDIGSDSAFTLDTDGKLSGYVLNRQGERVAPEEFVTPSPVPTPTPSPTPSPTPVPTPTPSPTPSPSPTPTPVPTPTLSPYQRAVMQAPELEVQEDAGFEKRNDLKVYSAPGENTWRASGAVVTTDDKVKIFGTENGYVLVDYPIGNGSRGRIGYIDDVTLDDPETVKPLSFCSIPVPLYRDAEGTDDPLHGQAAITTFQKGSEVTLLAFLGEEWAYVQTGLEGRVCRLFIPRDALLEE